MRGVRGGGIHPASEGYAHEKDPLKLNQTYSIILLIMVQEAFMGGAVA